jgi:hypothetical protein
MTGGEKKSRRHDRRGLKIPAVVPLESKNLGGITAGKKNSGTSTSVKTILEVIT